MATYEELTAILDKIYIHKDADEEVRLYACKGCMRICLAYSPMDERGLADDCIKCHKVYCVAHMKPTETGDMICNTCAP